MTTHERPWTKQYAQVCEDHIAYATAAPELNRPGSNGDSGLSRVGWSRVACSQATGGVRSSYSTGLPNGSLEAWVGSPLRVHRRYDPMFTVSNTVA